MNRREQDSAHGSGVVEVALIKSQLSLAVFTGRAEINNRGLNDGTHCGFNHFEADVSLLFAAGVPIEDISVRHNENNMIMFNLIARVSLGNVSLRASKYR